MPSRSETVTAKVTEDQAEAKAAAKKAKKQRQKANKQQQQQPCAEPESTVPDQSSSHSSASVPEQSTPQHHAIAPSTLPAAQHPQQTVHQPDQPVCPHSASSSPHPTSQMISPPSSPLHTVLQAPMTPSIEDQRVPSVIQSRIAHDAPAEQDRLMPPACSSLTSNLNQFQALAESSSSTSELMECTQADMTQPMSPTESDSIGWSTTHHAVQPLVAEPGSASTDTKARIELGITAQSVTSADVLPQAEHVSAAASLEESMPASILLQWQTCPITKVSMHMCIQC